MAADRQAVGAHPEPQPAIAAITTPQQPTKVESPALEVTAPNVASPPSASSQRGFRGRVIEGTWRAAVSAPGYQMFNLDDVPISEGERPSEIVMPLLRGYAIHGRVFELSTGAGIAGAAIGFRRTEDWQAMARREGTTSSNEDGSFILDGVPGGHIVLTVGAPNHAFRELGILVDDQAPAQQIALSTSATNDFVVDLWVPMDREGVCHVPGALAGTTFEIGRFSGEPSSSRIGTVSRSSCRSGLYWLHDSLLQ